MDHITSFLAHDHDKVQPGLIMWRYIWKLFIVTAAWDVGKEAQSSINCTEKLGRTKGVSTLMRIEYN
jgi:hypothetical protein